MFFKDEESKAFKAFLGSIGDRIPLKGYTGYAGGLDTKSKTIDNGVKLIGRGYDG